MEVIQLDPASAATLTRLRDLTNRLEKQEAKTQSRDKELEMLKQITLHGWFFENSPDLLTVASLLTGHFIRVSPSFTKMLGWPEEHLLATPWINFVYPPDIPATMAAAERLSKDGKLRFTNRYLKNDGTWIEIEWRCSLSNTETGIVFAVGRPVEEP
jgi:PAS domain S-box-containing protein